MPSFVAAGVFTDTLPRGSVLTVTLAGTALLRRTQQAALREQTVLSSTTTYGPYFTDMEFAITCLSGTMVTSMEVFTGTFASANGGTVGSSRTMIASGSIQSTDSVVYLDPASAGGSMTVTLPAASSMPNQFVYLSQISAGTVSITGTISGASNWALGTQYQALTLHSNGSNWSALA